MWWRAEFQHHQISSRLRTESKQLLHSSRSIVTLFKWTTGIYKGNKNGGWKCLKCYFYIFFLLKFSRGEIEKICRILKRIILFFLYLKVYFLIFVFEKLQGLTFYVLDRRVKKNVRQKNHSFILRVKKWLTVSGGNGKIIKMIIIKHIIVSLIIW